MKKKTPRAARLSLLCVCLLAACAAATPAPTATPIPVPPGWKLVWHDEFDGTQLDEKKWNRFPADV